MAQQPNQFVAVQLVGGGAPADGAEIASSPWWPTINPAHAREVMRFDGAITPMRLRSALITAIAQTNSELRAWREANNAAGYQALSAVPGEIVDDENELVGCYRQAIYCSAAADLLERMRDYDTTWEGHTRADRVEWPIDDYRRDRWYLIQRILAAGVSGSSEPRHNIIELI